MAKAKKSVKSTKSTKMYTGIVINNPLKVGHSDGVKVYGVGEKFSTSSKTAYESLINKNKIK